MNRQYHTSQRGFTLIEIMISVFIFAMMVSIAVPTINNLTDAKMKSAAQKLSGNLKYLYDRAILERIYIRLIIDLDTDTYWTESTKDPFFLQQKPQSVEEGAVVIEDEEDEEEDELARNFEESAFFDTEIGSEEMKWGGWAAFAEKYKKRKAVFGTYRTELAKKTQLPSQIQFYQIDTPAVEEPVKAGQIYIHFFPNGFVEKSSIWLAKKSELEDEDLGPEDYDIYSILVKPLTGRSVIYDYGVPLPEDLLDEEEW